MNSFHTDEAKLIGYLDLVGEPMAFVLPLFQTSPQDNVAWAQVLDERGMVTAFRPVTAPQVIFSSVRSELVVGPGEESVWGFRWEEGDFAIERQSKLQNLLSQRSTLKRARFNPLLRLEIINFCEMQEARNKAIVDAYRDLKSISLKCANFWRDDQIIKPLMRSFASRLEAALGEAKGQTFDRTSLVVSDGVVRVTLSETMKSHLKNHPRALQEISETLHALGLDLVFEDARKEILKNLQSLWRHARNKGVDRSQIDDLVNEVVVQALSERSGKPRYLPIERWLHILMRNAITSHQRRAHRRRRHEEDTSWIDYIESFEDAEFEDGLELPRDVGQLSPTIRTSSKRMATMPEQEWKVRYIEFQHALERLPQDQREAIVLVGGSGFSYEDAASIMGCTVGTVKSRINRGVRKLRELFQETGTAAEI